MSDPRLAHVTPAALEMPAMSVATMGFPARAVTPAAGCSRATETLQEPCGTNWQSVPPLLSSMAVGSLELCPDGNSQNHRITVEIRLEETSGGQPGTPRGGCSGPCPEGF